ncbi:unnamed protein product [Aduncisulcus paluster]|uniref:Unnamed protein product n=1 Tax=Aduncisulcus paluster TaxID=2918883 RepID=A0ABQ5KV80_9EUKA|nr:unnamed protein product [Aduncisulcus paluster]
MSRKTEATSCTEALRAFEQKSGESPFTAKHLKLWFQKPPIMDMTDVLSKCKECVQLSLSTNAIRRIDSISGMDKLEILSLSRNNIRKIENLSGVAGTLKELWISYNHIDSTHGVEELTSLKVFCAGNNKIDKWPEITRLATLPALEELYLVGNPIEIRESESKTWRTKVLKQLPKLKKLDGIPVTVEELEAAGVL